VKSSESLFSIGNGAMGQRANFEENYTGKTFQGSYIEFTIQTRQK
jgi:maltose phosphorylase